MTKTGKEFGSMIANKLLLLNDIFHYIQPMKNMIIWLRNDFFKGNKERVKKLKKIFHLYINKLK